MNFAVGSVSEQTQMCHDFLGKKIIKSVKESICA